MKVWVERPYITSLHATKELQVSLPTHRGCGDKYLEPAGDSSDFIAMKRYWAEGDLAEELAASIPVRFADLPTSEASVVLNFEAARLYVGIDGQRPGALWSNDVNVIIRKGPELSVPVVAAQLTVPTL